MKTYKFITIFSVILSTVAICLSGFRVLPIQTDWATLLVTILSAIVCALLGWQIYTLLDLRKIQADVFKTRAESLIDNERNATITCHAIADYYYSIVVGESPNSNEYNLIYYRISELFHASHINDKQMCESIIKALNEIIVKPENIKVTETNRKHILELYLQTAGGAQMKGYISLLGKLSSLGLSYNR